MTMVQMRCFKPEKGAALLRNSRSRCGVENSFSQAHSLFGAHSPGSQVSVCRCAFSLAMHVDGLGRSGLESAELQLRPELNPRSFLNEVNGPPSQLR